MDCRDTEERLDAYLDRELEPAEAASVREHLDGCGTCRTRLADRESLSRLVRQATYFTAPDGLRAKVAHARARRPTAHWLAWAAGIVVVASLAGSAWFLRPSAPATDAANAIDSVAEAVVDSHVRAMMAEHLFDVRSTDQHTVKPWFLGKVDFSPPVDDLATLGFPLTGGRLDYVAGRPAAALIYARGRHTINLFVWPEAPDSRPSSDARAIRGFHVRHWTRAAMSFWAVSDLNDAELDQFVGALQR